MSFTKGSMLILLSLMFVDFVSSRTTGGHLGFVSGGLRRPTYRPKNRNEDKAKSDQEISRSVIRAAPKEKGLQPVDITPLEGKTKVPKPIPKYLLFTPSHWTPVVRETTTWKYLAKEYDVPDDFHKIQWGDPMAEKTTHGPSTASTVDDSRYADLTTLIYADAITTQQTRNDGPPKEDLLDNNGLEFPALPTEDRAFSLCGRGPGPKETYSPDEGPTEIFDAAEHGPLEESNGEEHLLEFPPGNEDFGTHFEAEVANGDNANPVAWPWMTAIYRKQREGVFIYWCGGSLIDRSTIVTAAHCFHNRRNASEYFVRLGDYDLSSDDDSRIPESVNVDRIIIHEDYAEGSYANDIAILKLKVRMVYKNNISPVCTPHLENKNYTGKEGVVIGWGDIHFAGPSSNILQQANIPIISNEDCDNRFRKLKSYNKLFPDGISRQFICADFGERNQDACQGDSGGPLMHYNFEWDIIGIVSFGVGCNREGFAGVYTRIDQYIDWINSYKET